MDGYRLSKPAEHDFANILRYTIKTWGMEQGQVYSQLLSVAMARMMENPQLPGSKAREDLATSCRAFRIAKHVIFYRINGNFLEIARILHESMDFPRHVDEETFR